MRRALFAAVVATTTACGSSAPPVAKPKAQPAVDAKEAEKGAKDVVTSIYESIGHGDTDGLMTLATEKLVVFGPRRGDAQANRSDALVALGKEVSAKKKPTLASSTLQVVPSDGGHSAWAFDIVDVGGEPLAITAVLTNTDDIWLIDAAQLAHTPAAKVSAKELARDAVVPPGMTGVAAKIDPAAKAAADKFQKGLAAQDVWGDDLGTHSDALVVGPNAGEVTHGKKDVKKLWKKRLKANTREVLAGEIAAATTPDGELAWVSAPVTRATDDEAPTPMRVFAIYDKRGGEWKLVALQEAVAIDAPGAGAALAKKAPPAAAKPEAPTETAAADKPAKDPAAPKKPKKKKPKKPKKKPPPSDDDTETSDTGEDAPPPPPRKPMHKRPAEPDPDDADPVVKDDN